MIFIWQVCEVTVYLHCGRHGDADRQGRRKGSVFVERWVSERSEGVKRGVCVCVCEARRPVGIVGIQKFSAPVGSLTLNLYVFLIDWILGCVNRCTWSHQIYTNNTGRNDTWQNKLSVMLGFWRPLLYFFLHGIVALSQTCLLLPPSPPKRLKTLWVFFLSGHGGWWKRLNFPRNTNLRSVS